jgi:hypothetical protein
MELALQVVGLGMTGKIEDAKSVALRIVGNTGDDGPENNNPATTMQMTSTRDLRPLLFARAGETDNFESRLIDFLSILDTPMAGSAPSSVYTANAISHASSSGLTLLHLSTFLGFNSLTRFLIAHGADLDARDRNGFTPLHFAALSQSNTCASALIKAGADLDIVNSLGKTAQEITSSEFFGTTISGGEGLEIEGKYFDDDDATFGDVEEDDDVRLSQIIRRRNFRRSSRLHGQSGMATPSWSSNVSRAASPPPAPSDENVKKLDEQAVPNVADAKWVASFMENLKMIQRTLTQIPARQGIISHIPQLPIRHLSDLPAVPWGNLPQIPMVFPILVPINWPLFRGGEQKPTTTDGNNENEDGGDTTRNMAGAALRTAQDWRATWEKWVALAIATAVRQQTEDVPPPVYTPKAEEKTQIMLQDSAELKEQPVASTSRRSHPEARPVGYDSTPVPDQVVESFKYKPNAKKNRRPRKKRMVPLSYLSF